MLWFPFCVKVLADQDLSQEEDLVENMPAASGGQLTLGQHHRGMTGMMTMKEMVIMMITRGTGEEGETEELRDREWDGGEEDSNRGRNITEDV